MINISQCLSFLVQFYPINDSVVLGVSYVHGLRGNSIVGSKFTIFVIC